MTEMATDTPSARKTSLYCISNTPTFPPAFFFHTATLQHRADHVSPLRWVEVAREQLIQLIQLSLGFS